MKLIAKVFVVFSPHDFNMGNIGYKWLRRYKLYGEAGVEGITGYIVDPENPRESAKKNSASSR